MKASELTRGVGYSSLGVAVVLDAVQDYKRLVRAGYIQGLDVVRPNGQAAELLHFLSNDLQLFLNVFDIQIEAKTVLKALSSSVNVYKTLGR